MHHTMESTLERVGELVVDDNPGETSGIARQRSSEEVRQVVQQCAPSGFSQWEFAMVALRPSKLDRGHRPGRGRACGSGGAQGADDRLWVMLDDGQVGANGNLRPPTALLPVLQRPHIEPEQCSEVRLR
jgi:hypothetical protein